MLWWILFVVCVIYYYVRCYKPHTYWEKRNVAHEKPWPIVGNMGPSIFRRKSFAEYIDDFSQRQDGRYFGFYALFERILVLKDTELIKQITIKDFDSFLDHRPFISEEIDPLFGRNLFSLKGQKWRNMRSILSPAFTGSKMRTMYNLMADAAEQFTNYFIEQSKTQTGPIDLEMKDTLTRFANDVIATTAFGIQCDSMKYKDNEFYLQAKDASNFSGIRSLKFLGYNLSPMLMNFFKIKMFSDDVCAFFRNLVKTTMDTREAKGILRPDMIHLLIEAKKGRLKHESTKDTDAGFATVEESEVGKDGTAKVEELTDDDFTAQVLLFFLAGFETVSLTMCHLAQELAVNPDIQTKLQEEIDEAFEMCQGHLTYDIVTKMKYLDMVVCETLRKWPGAIITDRVCTKPYTIKPVGDEKPLQLEKGMICWIPVYAVHRNPENFPEPEKFDPERFSDENKDKINPLAYIPFGSGPRNCIGSRFALIEIKTVFAYLLRRFSIVVTKKSQVPIRLQKSDFNLNSESGFWLGLKLREITN